MRSERATSTHLLSPGAFAVLRRLRRTGSLFCFDFDGTLAPIVGHPDQAHPSAEVALFLGRLRQSGKVAIISGRSTSDLRVRLGCEVDYLIGNHGMEGLPGSRPVASVREACGRWKALLEPALISLGESGVWIEDKGLSLSIHYRDTADPKGVGERVKPLLESLGDGSRVVGGKWVFNIVSEGALHKGGAVLRLLDISGASRALFIGDDDTDEDVFSLGNGRIIGVRVGPNSASRAQYFLNSQAEVVEALRRITQGDL